MEGRLQAIIMAAGKSSRFSTNRSKLVEKICGQEMILYTTKIFDKLKIPTSVIVGHKKEEIQKIITEHHGSKVSFVEQAEQKGTAHALMCSKPIWDKENILIINGDAPLVSQEILKTLCQKHLKSNASVSFISAHNIDPSLNSYGKVIEENNQIKIVEAKDYQEIIKNDPSKKTDTCCINAGIYIFKKDFLTKAISKIETSSVTGEFYITDLISIASKNGDGVEVVDAPVDQIRGINTIRELWVAEQIKQSEIINHWMTKGVRFQSAQNTYVELNVAIDSGTFIGQGSQLYGNTNIKEDCTIEPFAIIKNSTIGKNTSIKSFSIVKDTDIKENVSVGPFANITSGSVINVDSNIGNFVEIKASNIGAKSEIKHLSYIGNTKMGTDVKIGAGTIVCDHNGIKVDKTTIKDKAYIGSNNTIVSPVTIGKNAFTAAGSTITKDVPNNAMSIARSFQTNKNNYASKIESKKTVKKTATFTGAIKDKSHIDSSQL
jgi:bifunctional UDP-N-acetylglucosamine pyrophosphorylase/glucosamine-1-phosphate N-acetyltransferase